MRLIWIGRGCVPGFGWAPIKREETCTENLSKKQDAGSIDASETSVGTVWVSLKKTRRYRRTSLNEKGLFGVGIRTFSEGPELRSFTIAIKKRDMYHKKGPNKGINMY